MKTPPFFSTSPPDVKLPFQVVRYPYHDMEECPEGQQVKRSGQWQDYEPSRVADTRFRCATCLAMAHLPNS